MSIAVKKKRMIIEEKVVPSKFFCLVLKIEEISLK